MKPRISFGLFSGEWLCGDMDSVAFGATPLTAYQNWKRERMGKNLRIDESGAMTFELPTFKPAKLSDWNGEPEPVLIPGRIETVRFVNDTVKFARPEEET